MEIAALENLKWAQHIVTQMYFVIDESSFPLADSLQDLLLVYFVEITEPFVHLPFVPTTLLLWDRGILFERKSLTKTLKSLLLNFLLGLCEIYKIMWWKLWIHHGSLVLRGFQFWVVGEPHSENVSEGCSSPSSPVHGAFVGNQLRNVWERISGPGECELRDHLTRIRSHGDDDE